MRETDRVQAARRELRQLDAAGLSADDAMAERLRVIVRLYEVERSAERERIADDARRRCGAGWAGPGSEGKPWRER